MGRRTRAAASQALAAMAAFAQAEFELELRVAMIPVGDIRAAGRDVRVARFAASQHCVYAMFAGGGLSWFEEQAKRGGYALPPAPPGALPDLSGLSCRWGVAPAKHGLVLSVIVAPRGDDPRFAALVDEVVAMALAAAQRRTADHGREPRARRSRRGDRARGLRQQGLRRVPRSRPGSAPRRATSWARRSTSSS